MNKELIFIKELHELHKFRLYLLLCLNLFAGIVLYFFNPIEELMILFAMGLMWFSIFFASNNSIFSNVDGFSLKYLRTLPLSKKELILTCGLSNLYLSIPTLVFVLIFANKIEPEWSFLTSIKIFLALIPLSFIMGVQSVTGRVLFPRSGYFENLFHKKKQYAFFRNLCVIVGLGCVLIIALEPLQRYISLDFLVNGFKWTASSVKWLVTSWFFPIILCLIGFQNFLAVTKDWNNKSFYLKEYWVPKRDLSIIGCSLACVVTFIYLAVNGSHSYYADSPYLSAIQKRDLSQIVALHDKGQDILAANKYGFTPLMAAAFEGDLPIFKFLLSKGAQVEGRVNYPNKETIHGANLLHLAVLGKNEDIVQTVLDMGIFDVNEQYGFKGYSALSLTTYNCSSTNADKLLAKGANPDIITKDQMTPLHYAISNNCILVGIQLLDYGARTDIKDLKGKLAVDYLGNKKTDLNYYFEKKLRSPASLKQ